MKKFNRIKKIKNKEYVYEITPYYDSKTKKTKHKSKYLGIYNGNINNPLKKGDMTIPKKILDYGEYLPFLKCVEETDIFNLLKDISSNPKEILVIALNKCINPISLKSIKSWAQGNVLSEKYSNLKLSSQNISEIFKRIGQEDLKDKFCKKYAEKISAKKTLFYDITSFSSYSKLINFLEYGYNRDKQNLPQFNMSLIVEKNENTPLYYDLYPGNITDQKTIDNSLEKIKNIGINKPLLVLDRGFCNKENIFKLYKKTNFVLGATLILTEIKEVYNKNLSNLEEPSNLKKFNNQVIFTKKANILLKKDSEEIAIFGHMYYDPERANKEKISFYNKLYHYLNEINSLKSITQDKIDDVCMKYKKYFSFDGTKLTFNDEEIRKKINTQGKYLILTNDNELKWDDILSNYKGKDMAEKGFLLLKNYFGSLPANLQSEKTLEGLVFILFISLIIEMRLMKKMKNSELIKSYSIQDLIVELHKIKKINLKTTSIHSEMTKKQIELLEKLDCCA